MLDSKILEKEDYIHFGLDFSVARLSKLQILLGFNFGSTAALSKYSNLPVSDVLKLMDLRNIIIL